MKTNINPETGKRWYRKKKPLEQRFEETGVNGCWFLQECQTCRKVRDREDLFQGPFDHECLLCQR
jgi:hypothetical protein